MGFAVFPACFCLAVVQFFIAVVVAAPAAAASVFSVVSKKEGSNKEDVSCLFASVDGLSFVIRCSTKRKRNRPIGHRCLPERDG